MSEKNRNDYVCLSAMLRAREAGFLGRDRLERMLDEPTFADACRVAAEAGYPDMSEMDVKGINAALAARRAAEVSELGEMLGEGGVLALFRLPFDCHNAKAIVKAEGSEARCGALLSDAGAYTPDQLRAAYAETDTAGLPALLCEAIAEAKQTLARTGNPQAADNILDRACFALELDAAKETDSPFILDYVRSRIDKVNLRSALRTLGLPRRDGLLRGALIEGGSVDPSAILIAGGKDELGQLFSTTAYAKAAECGSMTDFEKAADNAEQESLQSATLISFGPEVVVEYLSALEGELMSLRIVLTGRRMGIAPATLRERLRESYV